MENVSKTVNLSQIDSCHFFFFGWQLFFYSVSVIPKHFRYLESIGAEDQKLHMTFLMYPPIEANFNAEVEALPRNKELPGVKSLLTRKDEFRTRCVNFTKDERWSLRFPLWEVR